MRIVGGKLSGRRFSGPRSDATRPTSERVREAVGSALEARGLIEDAVVLELFAGTGAMAFEALSRGARRAILVEKARPVAKAIEKSAAELGLADRVTVVMADLEGSRATWLERIDEPAQLVLIDPPYARIDLVPELLTALAEAGRVEDGSTVVVEHAQRHPPTMPLGFVEVSRYRYGDTAVWLARFTAAEGTHA